jgi:hypothetical protein
MSRLFVRLAAATLVLATTSCDDDDPKTASVLPTAPLPVVSPAAALFSAEVKVKGSTVCMAYDRERSKLLGELKVKPEDKDLLKRASAVAAVISDACN